MSQNGIRYISEECQNTIRCLLTVQIVLILYWSQSTTGVYLLDSIYKDSIFWSLYIAESEHKDSLNRGFVLMKIRSGRIWMDRCGFDLKVGELPVSMLVCR